MRYVSGDVITCIYYCKGNMYVVEKRDIHAPDLESRRNSHVQVFPLFSREKLITIIRIIIIGNSDPETAYISVEVKIPV